ncbi:MAG: 2-succinyl-5-enolpyruvyl-6-hydroxy-3-cyclohexene-1-carboxylic-acid synthase [Dehalococcoidales bacterium]|nr:2-succinyl-5-enolpyruvyl-6-hydroxy-3-cyclohexene-1-carboxylic-acid synthase [Dehalococcoidales bacterium]
MSFENRNYAFAGVFVDELARCGLKHVCICPGSRSSPLAISFARHRDIKKWVHLDERSAAFFALGIAKHTRQPVAVVCSSGTAVANLSPAIIEAFYSGAPLLALTADRPPELHDWGALQTIDQANLFGSHIKWSAAMPTPEVTPSLITFVRAMAGRAFATAAAVPAGPVHLNFPFREPLEPSVVATDFPDLSSRQEGRSEKQPYIKSMEPAVRAPSEQESKQLAARLVSKERGLIICGPDTDVNLAGSVVELARRLGYPVLADCLSGARCGQHDMGMVIDGYDMFIDDTELTGPFTADVIIRFGALPVSKPLSVYMERNAQARHILIDAGAQWRDPSRLAGEVWHVDGPQFCNGLAAALPDRAKDTLWSRQWHDLNKSVRNAMSQELETCDEMFEGKVFRELSGILPANSVLFTGNSMPIRDMDTFFPVVEHPVQFMANRGASGIDGIISTALGASAVSPDRVVLVIGDVSFYHDMNGLLAAKAFNLNATIIVINNDGGGIFSFLPQSACEDVFESCFATPHGLTFRGAAGLYGLNYSLTGDWTAFRDAVKTSLTQTGSTIIEVPGNRKHNVALHRKMKEKILSQVRKQGRVP